MMDKIISMLRKRREIVLAILDTIMILTAYLFAYYIRIDFGTLYAPETYRAVIAWLPFVAGMNLVFLLLFKVNRSLWLYISVDEVLRVGYSVASTNILWLIIVVLFHIRNYPRSIPVIAALLQMLFMLAVRLLYRMYRTSKMRSQRHHRAVIIGAGSAGAIVLRDLTVTDRYDAKVIGFVDDAEQKQGKIVSGAPVLGTTKDLPVIVEKYNIDIAYIAINNISKKRLQEIIALCENAGLKTQIVSFEMINGEQGITKVRNVSIDDLLGRNEVLLDNTGISAYLSGKTVMVTGAGGSIGSELVRQIIKYHPERMVLVDIYENTMYDLQQEILMQKRQKRISEDIDIICLIGSVRDAERIDSIMQMYHPSVVFHAAAHKHVPLVEDSPMEAIKNNVFGTRNVIQCSIKNHVERFVLISTDKAVNPTNVMGATKRMCELIVQGYRNNGVTKLCAVRFGNVLGSHGSVIPLFKRQIEEGGPVTVTDKNIIRYFMTIPEAARLVLQAGMYAKSGEIFVLDMGTPVKIDDLARNMIRLSGFEPDVDIKIQYTGLRPGEKMYEELLYDKDTHTKTDNDLVYVSEPTEISQEEVDRRLANLQKVLDEKGDYRTAIMNAIHVSR